MVPAVRTAPVAMTLMNSAPLAKICRTVARTWSTPLTTPNRRSLGNAASTSTASPGDVATPAGAGDVAPSALHPRPFDPSPVDGVPQSDVSKCPERTDIADSCEPGPEHFAGVFDADQCFLRPAAGYERGISMTGFDLADQVDMAVDEARKEGMAREVDDVGIGGHLRPDNQRLDVIVDDHDRRLVYDRP